MMDDGALGRVYTEGFVFLVIKSKRDTCQHVEMRRTHITGAARKKIDLLHSGSLE